MYLILFIYYHLTTNTLVLLLDNMSQVVNQRLFIQVIHPQDDYSQYTYNGPMITVEIDIVNQNVNSHNQLWCFCKYLRCMLIDNYTSHRTLYSLYNMCLTPTRECSLTITYL